MSTAGESDEEGPSQVHNEDSDVDEDEEVDEELGSLDEEDLDDEDDDDHVCNHDDDDDDGVEPDPTRDDDIEQQQEVPKDIEFSSNVVGVSCHPNKNIVASGSISGPVTLHTFDASGNKEIVKFEHHKKPCRAIKFSEKGEYLFTASADASICIVDLESNSVYRKLARDNGSPLYCILPIDDYLMAGGEEDGQVVLWDFRMQAPVQCFEDCEDYISSMVINREKRTLLATSGDSTMAVYNVRGKKLDMHSEEFNCDLLSSGIFKNGTKVAIGAGDGAINIFNWGEFANISDRFPGHPAPINSIAVYSEDVVCTGCEDGKIRAVQLFPTRFLGVLGSHNGFAVEEVSLSHDKVLLASTSHDQKIKFSDLSGINDLTLEDVKDTKHSKHKQLNKEVNDFFSDLA